MVTLVVATTNDPASIGPASALLAMPGWQPGPFVQVSITRFPIFVCMPLTRLPSLPPSNIRRRDGPSNRAHPFAFWSALGR